MAKKRKRRKRKLRLGILPAIAVLVFAGIFLTVKSVQKESIPASCREWNLILVNRDHPLPESYEAQLLKLSNGEYVDERMYPYLQEMFDQARSQGVTLYVRSGYRSREKQEEIFERRIQSYIDQGMSHDEAKAETEKWVLPPGTSEHETGLCVDINSKDRYLNQKTADWLHEHAAEYGFVQRYRTDKSDITGVNNEDWHYRYVGREAAEAMVRDDLCLEEYVRKGCSY